jgi:hypothetical protein
MLPRLFQHWTTRVAEFTQGRTPQADAEFLTDCKLPAAPHAQRVALIVRAVVAEEGSVDPRFILASDRYPEDLEILPSWDSPDWLDFILRWRRNSTFASPIAMRTNCTWSVGRCAS